MNSKTSDQTDEGGARAGGAEGSLGEQLRRAREARGMTLREVSEHTRITMRHLEAIEADDFKNLPGGIFNKSFVRAYARDVKFDEHRALELYERTARERGFHADEVATTPQRSRVYMGDPARSPWVTFALSAFIVGILILIVYAGLHYYRRQESQPAAAATPTATPAPAASQGAPQQAGAQPTPAAAEGFNVQIRTNEQVWMRVRVDDQTMKDAVAKTWNPGDSQALSPRERLTVNYAKNLAGALEVSVNGSQLRAPTDTKPGVTQEWVITKDNYRQFAQ